MGILSGLGNMGIDLKDGNLFADEKKEKAAAAAEQKKPEEIEEEFLLKKTLECPVCGKEFSHLAVKTNRMKLLGQDIDLRPKYDPFDSLKYSAIMCHECGYSARGQAFNDITTKQKAVIREKIGANYRNNDHDEDKTTYDYDTAIRHYQMAIACAVVKGAKNSEKAYLCLQTAWIVRGKREKLDKNSPAYQDDFKECRANEVELLNNSLEGFIKARSSEDFPMCGMDENTVDYIIAALGYECGKFDVSTRLLSELLVSKTANTRIKDKARNLKELILEKKNQ